MTATAAKKLEAKPPKGKVAVKMATPQRIGARPTRGKWAPEIRRPIKMIGQPRIVMLDETYASELLGYNTYTGQREVKKAQVVQLCEKIAEEHFHVARIALAILPDGTKILMNGQHCCQAALATHTALVALLEEYECQDEIDLAILFGQFDTATQTRTLGDQLYAWIQGTELVNYPRALVRLVTEALKLQYQLRAELPETKMAIEERVTLLYDHVDTVGAVHEIMLRRGERKAQGLYGFMSRASVIAALIETYRLDKLACHEFWIKVRYGEMISSRDPAYKLRNWLLGVKLGISGTNRRRPRKGEEATGALLESVTSREVFARSVHAWNSFAQGTSTALKYFPNAPLPRALRPRRQSQAELGGGALSKA